jgi:phosphoglycolate phosphatase-like HAD superfamily hydrolase
VTRDDVPALKPDPRGLAMTFARLDDRSVRFFVGDSWIDAAAAQALGVPFVALGLAPDVVAGHGLAPVAWHAGSLDEALRVIEQAAAAAAKDGQAPPGQREGRAWRDG